MSAGRGLAALLLLAIAAAAAGPPPAPAPDQRQQLSYTVGYDVGHNLLGAGPYADRAALLQGLEDSWNRREPRYPEGTMRQTMIDVATLLRTPRAAPPAAASELPARFSYSLGNSIGDRLYLAQERLNLPTLEQAVAEGLDGKAPQVGDATRAMLSADLQNDLAQRHARLAAMNLQKSETFLAANRKQPGVQVTASGLQYQVLAPGSGARPGKDGKVTVNYSGSLIDGQVFDDLYRRGQAPAQLALDTVNAGLAEGLQLMRAGSRYRLWLPPALAYGELGAGMKVGPNQALVFEVDLLKVE